MHHILETTEMIHKKLLESSNIEESTEMIHKKLLESSNIEQTIVCKGWFSKIEILSRFRVLYISAVPRSS